MSGMVKPDKGRGRREVDGDRSCLLVFVQMLPGSLHNMRKLAALFPETRALDRGGYEQCIMKKKMAMSCQLSVLGLT